MLVLGEVIYFVTPLAIVLFNKKVLSKQKYL